MLITLILFQAGVLMVPLTVLVSQYWLTFIKASMLLVQFCAWIVSVNVHEVCSKSIYWLFMNISQWKGTFIVPTQKVK
jgi:hypothetical protein